MLKLEFTVGIALPQWIVHRDNTVFVSFLPLLYIHKKKKKKNETIN